MTCHCLHPMMVLFVPLLLLLLVTATKPVVVQALSSSSNNQHVTPTRRWFSRNGRSSSSSALLLVASHHRGEGRQQILNRQTEEENVDCCCNGRFVDTSTSSTELRRQFLFRGVGFFLIAGGTMLPPRNAMAGIDVSGLPVEGKTGIDVTGLPVEGRSRPLSSTAGSTPAVMRQQQQQQQDSDASSTSAATYALRGAGSPILRDADLLGFKTRYQGYVLGPDGGSGNSVRRYVAVSFEFPSDWLQLDKMAGGISYVDQRNGDKLYVLRCRLPDGMTLETVPKTYFGDVIFNPAGSIVRCGTVVDGYRVSKSNIVEDSAPKHRRLLLKYDTVTGNGVQTVERRGLVNAYQIENDVYMLMTSSNAVKFDANGKERDTVESIINSFRVIGG